MHLPGGTEKCSSIEEFSVCTKYVLFCLLASSALCHRGVLGLPNNMTCTHVVVRYGYVGTYVCFPYGSPVRTVSVCVC